MIYHLFKPTILANFVSSKDIYLQIKCSLALFAECVQALILILFFSQRTCSWLAEHSWGLHYIHYIYEQFLLFLKVSGDRECSWSRDTVQLVDSCPFNSITYEQRRKDKNCEAIAKRQNCTTPSKFLYHCLINEYGNALIEVCAPIYIINGTYTSQCLILTRKIHLLNA